ncbi:hypothetical protein GW17_00029296, partial [Ensete ventricosum]
VFDAVVSLCLPLAISDNVPLYPISLQSSQSRYNPARKRVNSVPFFGCFPPPVSWFPYISCSCRCPVSEDRGGFWRRRGEEELREAVVIEAVGGSGDPAASFLVWDARVIWSVPGLGIRNGMAVQDGAEARIAGKPDASSSYLHKFRLYETRSVRSLPKFHLFGLSLSSHFCRRRLRPLTSSPNVADEEVKETTFFSSFEATRRKRRRHRRGSSLLPLSLYGSFFWFQQSAEKKPRESILRAEFANAIEFLNKDVLSENRLMFLHWDLHKHSRR